MTCHIFDVIAERISEVLKGTSRNTKNENKRDQIFKKVLHMNLEYVSEKKNPKRKIKTNKQRVKKHKTIKKPKKPPKNLIF
jgi:hypothetical protein